MLAQYPVFGNVTLTQIMLWTENVPEGPKNFLHSDRYFFQDNTSESLLPLLKWFDVMVYLSERGVELRISTN